MPNTTSAKKRLKQNAARRERNRAARSAVRSQVKKVRAAVAAGDVGKAEEEFRLAAQKLDRAGARNIVHENAAARTKSRLQKLIKNAKSAS